MHRGECQGGNSDRRGRDSSTDDTDTAVLLLDFDLRKSGFSEHSGEGADRVRVEWDAGHAEPSRIMSAKAVNASA